MRLAMLILYGLGLAISIGVLYNTFKKEDEDEREHEAERIEGNAEEDHRG